MQRHSLSRKHQKKIKTNVKYLTTTDNAIPTIRVLINKKEIFFVSSHPFKNNEKIVPGFNNYIF